MAERLGRDGVNGKSEAELEGESQQIQGHGDTG